MRLRKAEAADRTPSRQADVPRYGDTIRQLFAPVSDALIDEAEIAPGHSVLDVGTGSGEPALRIAEVVGSRGEVVGIDPVAGMIDASRREADRRSLTNARFETAGVDRLPFADDRFDAVVSRFGAMFFPAPVAGVREMLRVVKPGNKVAFAVWHFRVNNPFHEVLARLVDEALPTPALPPDAPEPFRYAAAGKLRAIVAEAGAVNPAERLFRFSIDVQLSPEDFWDLRMEMSEKLKERLSALPPDRFAALKRQAIAAFREYSNANVLSFPTEVRLVSARK